MEWRGTKKSAAPPFPIATMAIEHKVKQPNSDKTEKRNKNKERCEDSPAIEVAVIFPQ